MAISAFNCKKYNEALGLWDRLKDYDEEGYLGDYYYDIAAETKEGIREFRPLPYICQLPKEEIGRRIDKVYYFLSLDKYEIKDLLKKDNSLKDVIYFIMGFDKLVLRKMIFDKIRKENLIELEDIIRRFILKPDVEKSIKIESVFLLNKIGSKEPYHVLLDDEVRAVSIDSDSLLKDEWKDEWEDVKNITLRMMKNYYNNEYAKIVEDIWYDFIRSTYPDVPKIGKKEIWAAALEFAYCKFTCKEVTQQQLAEKYKVSRSSISQKSKIIFSYIGNKFGERE